MGKLHRIANVLIGLATIFCGLVLIAEPRIGIHLIIILLSISLTIYGLRTLVFYITMARHMVGGMRMLYVSIIALDLGLFSVTLLESSPIYLAFFLSAVLIFDGGMGLMRALEARKLHAPYRMQLFTSITTVIVALLCLVFLRSPEALTYAYSAALCYSACLRIASALKNTDIVYIP